ASSPAAVLGGWTRASACRPAAWLAGPLPPFAGEPPARLDPAVIRPAVVRELLQAHVERRRDNRRELWALIVLQLWADGCGVAWSSAERTDAELATVASPGGGEPPPSR